METIKMEEGVVNMNFANHRTYDVLVAGGGVAGVAAAVEAARGAASGSRWWKSPRSWVAWLPLV